MKTDFYPLSDYFDKIYVVNLQHEIENRLKITKHLKAHHIQFELFEAVNGYQGEAYNKWLEYSSRPLGSLTRFPEFNEKEIARGNHYIESAGAIGYIYTYIAILKNAKRRHFKKILILEDDVILSNQFHQDIKEFINAIGTDWKVLHLGASQYNWDLVDLEAAESNKYYYPRRFATCGSFAIAIDHSIFDELIDYESSFEAPFDNIPMGEVYEKYVGQCYVAYPNLVMPDVGTSSIRGGRNQHEHGKRMKWNVNNFEYPQPKVSLGLVVRSPSQVNKLLNAAKRGELPVTLAIFGLSPDGPRPIHNADLTTVEDWGSRFPEETLSRLPTYDFYAYKSSTSEISEQDLIRFVESRLGLSSVNCDSLTAFEVAPRPVVEGRTSTIIPSYKRPDNLQGALTSVARQSWENKEIIVVSDNGKGSKFNDETRAVVEQVQKKHPKVAIHYIEHSINRNGAAARNTGLQYATGEFITFLDDDDEYLDGRLEKAVNRLQARPKNIGAAYCGFLGWNSPANNEARYLKGDLKKHILTLDYKKHYLHTNTATYRRSYIDQINGFDESYPRHQDLEFNLRYMTVSCYEVVPECLVRLTPRASNINNKIYGTRFLNIKKKFLEEFRWMIDGFDKKTRDEIYHKHWDEVHRYVADEEEMLDTLKKSVTNGELQLLLRISGSL